MRGVSCEGGGGREGVSTKEREREREMKAYYCALICKMARNEARDLFESLSRPE
jgi:hypothetical protein